MTQTRQSSVDRLQDLPAVFTAPWLRRQMGWDVKTASVYLNRWKARGWLALAGPRCGIYYNLLTEQQVNGEMRIKALQLAYPSAHLVGETVLHAAGWITQIPQSLHAMVLSRPSLAELDGVMLHPRPRRWLAKVHGFCAEQGQGVPELYGLPSLPPALALVDAYGDAAGWHPDPDDLDVPREDEALVLKAFGALNVAVPEALREAWGVNLPTPGKVRRKLA